MRIKVTDGAKDLFTIEEDMLKDDLYKGTWEYFLGRGKRMLSFIAGEDIRKGNLVSAGYDGMLHNATATEMTTPSISITPYDKKDSALAENAERMANWWLKQREKEKELYRTGSLKFWDNTMSDDSPWGFGEIDLNNKAPRKGKKMFNKSKPCKDVEDDKISDMESMIKGMNSRLQDLESEIDKLKHPMGEIKSAGVLSAYFHSAGEVVYCYGNERYKIPNIATENIVAFRKKNDYVEFKLVTENGMFDENNKPFIVKATGYATFLLKDTLIPIDAVYDFGNTEWVEVGK